MTEEKRYKMLDEIYDSNWFRVVAILIVIATFIFLIWAFYNIELLRQTPCELCTKAGYECIKMGTLFG